mmetsp:Transcript_40080/g.51670  ORF Transcript_40080/g.51670 Transcript_40080/m.51670 type:complete len:91 (-) Transcript_40080:7-279(-)
MFSWGGTAFFVGTVIAGTVDVGDSFVVGAGHSLFQIVQDSPENTIVLIFQSAFVLVKFPIRIRETVQCQKLVSTEEIVFSDSFVLRAIVK